jgi:hypothetical protein
MSPGKTNLSCKKICGAALRPEALNPRRLPVTRSISRLNNDPPLIENEIEGNSFYS